MQAACAIVSIAVMKARYLLFLTSCLCGIALAFAYSFYVHDGENVHGAVSQSSSAHALSDTRAMSIANRLVSDRDAALIARDRAALQALTVPDSPARQLDDALFEQIGDLDSVNTVVLDVHVLTDKEWEVHSIQ